MFDTKTFKETYNLTDAKQKKLLLLLTYVFLSSLVVMFIRPYYFYSILLVLLPPTLANFFWLKHSKLKILIFSVLTTLIFAPPLELATRLMNVWDVQSIFPRPFGLIPLENMLFAFINFFWGVSFYEYFVDADRGSRISGRFRYLLSLYIIMAALVYLLYFLNPQLIAASYFAMAVPTLILPGIIIFAIKPRLLKKAVLPTLFFALVFFVYEMVSLQVGSWWWPGEYLLSMRINGNIFPLDDIIIWYFLSTPVLIGGYEIFVDDSK